MSKEQIEELEKLATAYVGLGDDEPMAFGSDVLRLLEERKRLLGAANAVIYASDGCQGHAACSHSLDPWRDTRAAIVFAEEAAR